MTQATFPCIALFEKNYRCVRQPLLICFVLAVLLGVAPAQELDSSTLQKEQAEIDAAANRPRNPNQPPQQQTAPQSSQTTLPSVPQTPAAPGSTVLPAGTKLQLGLVRPLLVKKTNPGDTAYLQVTFPVSAGSDMVIPPGTYLQGVIGKIIRRDRVRAVLEFELSSADLIFSTGYTVKLPGVLDAAPVMARLSPPDVGQPQNIPAMGAVGSVATPPSLPTPSLGNGPRNAMIAVGVAAAASVVILAVAVHHSDVEMQVGTPVQIILPAPLELDRQRVTAAVQQYATRAANNPPPIVQPPPKPKMCYDPGTPGTPDTVIPGSPGTPPTVIPGGPGMPDIVIPGTPATPDTVIPGTPGTPGSSYPCK